MVLDSATAIQQLKDRVVTWAESQPEICAILVIGSRARRDFPADEWSDLDLMVFATDSQRYLTGDDWLQDIGQVWLNFPHQTGSGHQERLVHFDGGGKVDFVFCSVDDLRGMVESGELWGIYHRGYYVLVDKDELASQLPPSPFAPPPYEKPSADLFALAVNSFWHDAVYVARQIRRRNLWPAKMRNAKMKELVLLKMLEWHARAVNGWDYDTWHDGRFLSEWTDPQTWDELQDTFGGFGVAESWQALLAMMNLFRRLAVETASHLGYTYPVATDERFTRLVKSLYEKEKVRYSPGR
jgi:aminoglycoside 6-adenylyltransferase